MNDMIDSTKESIKWIVPIKGHEDYLLTNNGAVWSTKTKRWLKPFKTHEGHLQVKFNGKKKGYYIHRLVFEAFKRQLKKGEVVHHLNKIKSDNRIDNLDVMKNGDHSVLHNKGKIVSQQTRAKMRGNQNSKGQIPWIKGRHHSQQAKMKMRQAKQQYLKRKKGYNG